MMMTTRHGGHHSHMPFEAESTKSTKMWTPYSPNIQLSAEYFDQTGPIDHTRLEYSKSIVESTIGPKVRTFWNVTGLIRRETVVDADY